MATVSIDAYVEQGLWRVHPHTYASVLSRWRWKAYDYLVHISKVIRSELAKGGARIIVNMPPRHGKSELISFWLPLWYLDLYPERRIILTSYEAGIAMHWGRRVRNETINNPLCYVKLAEDSKSASRWDTPQGGGMVTAGIGGPISGRGFDLGIIDDPLKNWEEAQSSIIRSRCEEWFDSTFYTRQEPDANIIVLMTRWHSRDLTAYLLDKGERWTHINFPALAVDVDILGRQPGDPLCPQRFDVNALERIKVSAGDVVWNALYQGMPRDIGIGAVYRNFTAERNIDDSVVLRDNLPLHLSVDFNSFPHMHCLIGQYDERADLFVCYDEIARDGINDARAAGIAFCDWIDDNGGWRWPELQLFGDATGAIGESNLATGTSAWDVLRYVIRSRLPNVEVRWRVPRKNPKVVDRINAFDEALCDVNDTVHYVLTRRCKRLIEDFRSLRMDESGCIDKSDRRLSHASDAEGYRVHYLRPVWKSVHSLSDTGKARFSI